MSVRSKLLAILTIGPAYGFQLHSEIQSRTAHRRTINAGQIYSTLERAVDQGAVRPAGLTPDGLPLYELTDAGRAEAMEWLSGTASAAGDEWDDMVDRVLLLSSIPGSNAAPLIAAYRAYWGADRDAEHDYPARPEYSAQAVLASMGAALVAAAALDWLTQAERLIESTGPLAFQRALSTARPKRGRRPTIAAPSVSAAR